MTKKNYYKTDFAFWRNWIIKDNCTIDSMQTYKSRRIKSICFNRVNDFKYELLIFEPNNLIRYKIKDSSRTNNNEDFQHLTSATFDLLKLDNLRNTTPSILKGEVMKMYYEKEYKRKSIANFFKLIVFILSQKLNLEFKPLNGGTVFKTNIDDNSCTLSFINDGLEYYVVSINYNNGFNNAVKTYKFGDINKAVLNICKQFKFVTGKDYE